MNKKISSNLCTVCQKRFNFISTGNRVMCPDCRVQKRETGCERGHRDMFIFNSGCRKEQLAG